MGRRSEQRTNIRLPVRVSGRDRTNQSFWQTAQTLDISRSGARLEDVPDCLPGPGATVEIEYKGNTAHYLVVWIAPLGTPGAGQVGLRALDTNKNIWPVTFNATSDHYKLPNDAQSVSSNPRVPSNPSAATAKSEQRQRARVPCRIDATVSVAGSENWLRAIASDVSAHGCYLEMMSPLPVGTPVELAIPAEANAKIYCRGFVRHSDAPFGMGIEFTGLNEDERTSLHQIVEALQTEEI